MQSIWVLEREKLKRACECLKIPVLHEEDYKFIEEYVSIIRPIAHALKVLEGDKHLFGLYLPTLFGLKQKLRDLLMNEWDYCEPLIASVNTGFTNRFAHLMDIEHQSGKAIPLFLGMVTHPQFKMNFIHKAHITPEYIQKVQGLLVTAAETILRGEKAKRDAERQTSDGQEEHEANDSNSTKQCK